MLRIVLIHGYLEDPTIFDQLVPLIGPASFVHIDLADEFARWAPSDTINVQQLAQRLISQYRITAEDVIIGHSMGGWVAMHIKQLTNATTIQLASWTNQKKIYLPLKNLRLLKFMLDTRLTQNSVTNGMLKKLYPFKESFGLFCTLLDNSLRMSRLYIYQQFQTLFAKAPPLTVQPDLRIHARRDNIVLPPDEPFIEVPGDHFSLVFHAEAVAEPIRTLLGNRPTTAIA
ncbi:alpha/beta hydrolase [Spirosoma taeanense]|uniref:Alpha/beta hydrolase n=1 Tax=Spirosoma taeanense TaxID=2735870 RepID=A0A6M5YDB1_9BACT|nr:alpha/beta hydrolase [Spirosoma taeanense]QJW92008.1 alpha/beta hydrolase [Spirosoma taeanense]